MEPHGVYFEPGQRVTLSRRGCDWGVWFPEDGIIAAIDFERNRIWVQFGELVVDIAPDCIAIVGGI